MTSYHLHHPYSSLTPRVLRAYLSPTFIETGTNTGHGVQCALDVGFARVLSIEADPALAQLAHDRFAHDLRVRIWYGDSPAVLREWMPKIVASCTIYLDAHSLDANPLLEELDAIALSPCRAHIILIDDVRMFGSVEWFHLTRAEALASLARINPAYRISYADTAHAAGDLLVARV